MGKDIKNLVHKIDSAISDYDKNCCYKDFAKGVAGVMKGQYGEHLFKPFIEQLKKRIKRLKLWQ